mgnify:CR=1 FL=1
MSKEKDNPNKFDRSGPSFRFLSKYSHIRKSGIEESPTGKWVMIFDKEDKQEGKDNNTDAYISSAIGYQLTDVR